MGKKTKSAEPQQMTDIGQTSENGPFLSPQNTAVAPSIIRPLIKPRKYTSPKQMEPVMLDYYQTCNADGRKYTVEGLTLHLGFTSTETLRVYGTDPAYAEFHELIKWAKLKIQQQRVEDMQSGDLNAMAAIFLLSNCHGYYRDADIFKKSDEKILSGEIALIYEQPKQDEETGTQAEADDQTGPELSEAV